jgi:hypothetical protein
LRLHSFIIIVRLVVVGRTIAHCVETGHALSQQYSIPCFILELNDFIRVYRRRWGTLLFYQPALAFVIK